MAQSTEYDLERGELTPLLRSGKSNPDAGPLDDMKSDSMKEKAVTGIAGAGCEQISCFPFRPGISYSFIARHSFSLCQYLFHLSQQSLHHFYRFFWKLRRATQAWLFPAY